MTKDKLRISIKGAIKSNSKSVKAFCEKVGLSRFNLSAYVNNRQSLSIGSLITILKGAKKLPPEHNFFTGLYKIDVEVLLEMYNNKEDLNKVFKAIEEIRKQYQ